MHAIRLDLRLKEFGLYWLEEPCAAENAEALAEIRQATGLPIVIGEATYLKQGFRPLFQRRAADIINPHVAWYSEAAMVGLQAGAPGEVRRVLTGVWPVNVVIRAVKGRSRAGL